MGYSLSGKCHEDTAQALKAFNTAFPVMSDNGIVTLTASSINGTGLITYSTSARAWGAANATTTTGKTVQLPTCSESYVNQFETLATQDILIGLALIFAFLMGMSMGYAK